MAGSEPHASLEERLARLEAIVARLVEQVDERAAPASEPDVAPGGARERRAREIPRFEWANRPADGAPASPRPSRAEAEGGDLAASGERWLGRVGVAFVVLAFGFLFRYAFDQGWIGPPLRLLLGLVAATAMLLVGLRLEGERERYSQYLLGGAISVYYLVAYASYELYGLVPFAVAFAGMAATTVVAFVLAERQRLASLAVIGAGGGLATPFLVHTGSGNVPALVAYTMLLLAGAGTLQFWRGWRSLLVVLGLGGLAVMGAAVSFVDEGVVERAVAAVGVLAAWAVFGAMPLLRAHLHRIDPDTWPEPPLADVPDDPERARVRSGRVAITLLRIGCWMGALAAVVELGALVSASRAGHAPLLALGAAVYVALAWLLFATRPALNAAAEIASFLAMLAVLLLLFDARAFLPLALLGYVMHAADHRWVLPGVRTLAHALFAALGVTFLGRAAAFGAGAIASPFSGVEVTVLGAIVFTVTTALTLVAPRTRAAYLLGAHVAVLLWLAYQLAPLRLGQELISLSWGVYGIALLLLSLRIGPRGLQLTGLATLGLVAGKLLLVDMAQVDVIWRILLFMGFGAAFLGLSYLINRRAPEA